MQFLEVIEVKRDLNSVKFYSFLPCIYIYMKLQDTGLLRFGEWSVLTKRVIYMKNGGSCCPIWWLCKSCPWAWKAVSYLLLCFVTVVCWSSEFALTQFFLYKAKRKCQKISVNAKVSELRTSNLWSYQINHLEIWNMCLGKEAEGSKSWTMECGWCL